MVDDLEVKMTYIEFYSGIILCLEIFKIFWTLISVVDVLINFEIIVKIFYVCYLTSVS